MAQPRLTPQDPSLLIHNARHMTQVLDRDVHGTFKVQRSDHACFNGAEHPRVQQMLEVAGFIGPYKAWWTRLDHALVTALVERWRAETHTFHLTVGEATVTLQDVGVLWGLPVVGRPIPLLPEWGSAGEAVERLQTLCGVENAHTLVLRHHSRYCISSRALRELVEGGRADFPGDPSDLQAEQRARLWILLLLHGHLFSDSKGTYVQLSWLRLLQDLAQTRQYNWGAGMLAFLYRQLDMCVSGDRSYCLGGTSLLQVCFFRFNAFYIIGFFMLYYV